MAGGMVDPVNFSWYEFYWSLCCAQG